ncbi:MAG: hypothetical protein K8R36_03425 [Planctomycetales bacterium]|nr:hypothetical protein [Planctomycetales bacterium]
MALLLATLGCGGGDNTPKVKVTPVTGKVTLGGEPLADATLTFYLEGDAPSGYLGPGAKTGADGTFEAMTGTQKGAQAGTYKVTVNKMVGRDGKPVTADPETGMDLPQMIAGGMAKELVPPSYSDPAQTTTKITVVDGTPPPPLNIDIPKQ